MIATCEWVGLGGLPGAPIVSCLTRSLSAFYVSHGMVRLLAALDIRRYRRLARVLAVSGGMLLEIDITAGMPIVWTNCEGPPALPLVLLCCSC